MFGNPRRGRQARNFTRNVPKILDSQIVFRTVIFQKLTLDAHDLVNLKQLPMVLTHFSYFSAWQWNALPENTLQETYLLISARSSSRSELGGRKNAPLKAVR